MGATVVNSFNISLNSATDNSTFDSNFAFDSVDFDGLTTVTFRIIDNIRLDGVVIPEPSSVFLVVLGGLACIVRRRRS